MPTESVFSTPIVNDAIIELIFVPTGGRYIFTLVGRYSRSHNLIRAGHGQRSGRIIGPGAKTSAHVGLVKLRIEIIIASARSVEVLSVDDKLSFRPNLLYKQSLAPTAVPRYDFWRESLALQINHDLGHKLRARQIVCESCYNSG